jgi:hypothetical protein
MAYKPVKTTPAPTTSKPFQPPKSRNTPRLPIRGVDFESIETIGRLTPIRRTCRDLKSVVESYHFTDDWFKIFDYLFVETETRLSFVGALINWLVRELLPDAEKIPRPICRTMVYKILSSQSQAAALAYINLLNTYVQAKSRLNFNFIPEQFQRDVLDIYLWALKNKLEKTQEICRTIMSGIINYASPPKPFFDITWHVIAPEQANLSSVDSKISKTQESQGQTDLLAIASEPMSSTDIQVSESSLTCEAPECLADSQIILQTAQQIRELITTRDKLNLNDMTNLSVRGQESKPSPVGSSNQINTSNSINLKRSATSEISNEQPSKRLRVKAAKLDQSAVPEVILTRISSTELSCGKMFMILDGEYKNKRGVFVSRELSRSETVRVLVVNDVDGSYLYTQLNASILIRILTEEITHRMKIPEKARTGPLKSLGEIHVRAASKVITIQIRGGCWNGEYATVIRSWKERSLLWINGNTYPQYFNNDVLVVEILGS